LRSSTWTSRTTLVFSVPNVLSVPSQQITRFFGMVGYRGLLSVARGHSRRRPDPVCQARGTGATVRSFVAAADSDVCDRFPTVGAHGELIPGDCRPQGNS
jgi:hypothetical protein